MCGGVYIYGTRAAPDRQVGVGVGGPGSTYARRARPRTHGIRARTVRPLRPLSFVARPAHHRGQVVPDARWIVADPSSRALGRRSLGNIRDIIRHGGIGADSRGARTLLIGGPWLDARCKWLAGTSGLRLPGGCTPSERVRTLDGPNPPLPRIIPASPHPPRPSPAPNPLRFLGFRPPRRFCRRI